MATTCKLIAKNVLGSDTGSVTFSSIPATYTDLLLVVSGRTDRASESDPIKLQFNAAGSDTNHSCRVLQGNGTDAVSATESRVNGGIVSGNNATASTFGIAESYIPNYAGSAKKSVSSGGAGENNGTAFMNAVAGLWDSTNAITEIKVLPVFGSNFKSGSSFFLYGITKA